MSRRAMSLMVHVQRAASCRDMAARLSRLGRTDAGYLADAQRHELEARFCAALLIAGVA